MPDKPKRSKVFVFIVLAILIALACAYGWFVKSVTRALGPSVTIASYYEQLSAGWKEHVSGENFRVEVVPRFRDGPQEYLRIPRNATDILVARGHWVDASYWVAFTVTKGSLSEVVKEITGRDLGDFGEGMRESEYVGPPKGPFGSDMRKAAPYWRINEVKNGKHLKEEDGSYCGVDLDACRIYLQISTG
jgi:hypothetical protein